MQDFSNYIDAGLIIFAASIIYFGGGIVTRFNKMESWYEKNRDNLAILLRDETPSFDNKELADVIADGIIERFKNEERSR